MGLPTDRPNLRLHTADAAAFVADFVSAGAAAQRGEQQGQQGQQQQGEQQAGQQQRPGSSGAEGWAQPFYDLVFMDAFDGEDNIPPALCSPGEPSHTIPPLHRRCLEAPFAARSKRLALIWSWWALSAALCCTLPARQLCYALASFDLFLGPHAEFAALLARALHPRLGTLVGEAPSAG